MYLFEKLEPYNNAVRLAALIEMAAKGFPRSTQYFGERMTKISKSIHENLAQAHTTWKDVDKKSFFWQTREAIEECFGLIEVASRQHVMPPHLNEEIRDQLMVLRKQVQELIRGPAEWANTPKSPNLVVLEREPSQN